MDLDAPVALASAALGITVASGVLIMINGIKIYRQYALPWAWRVAVSGGVLTLLSIALLICLTVYQ